MSNIKISHPDELIIVRKELALQKEKIQKLETELIMARTELAFQKDERGKRAAELGVANKKLVFENEEKEKRAAELSIANEKLAADARGRSLDAPPGIDIVRDATGGGYPF